MYFGDNPSFFIGTVENRLDPEMLGRVQVRIFGVHSEDTVKIPTSDLPWAVVSTPTTSASLNGIGRAPTGVVEGSRVIGFFLDGQSKQQPVIIGTLNGFSPTPQTKTLSEAKTTESQRYAVFNDGKDENGNEIEELQQIDGKRFINLLVIHCAATPANMDVGVSEIDRWHRERGFDRIGYHFVIRRNGVIEKGRDISEVGAHVQGFNKNSIGICMVGGVNSQKVPENNFTSAQWLSLKTLVKKFQSEYPEIKVCGHNELAAKACPSFNVQSWLATDMSSAILDNISSVTDLNSILPAGKVPGVGDTNLDLDVSSTEAFKEDISAGKAVANDKYPTNSKGFIDPNGVYPRQDRRDEVDTNRLARHSGIEGTIVEKKEKTLLKDVPIGAGEETWSEPKVPYNARYPYNSIEESESGHVIEIDDTPGFERLHRYHRSGTFNEIHPDGKSVTKVVGDNYEIIAGSDYVYIKGDCAITIEGNVNLNVAGDVNAKIAGEVNVENDQNVNVKSKGAIDISSDEMIRMNAPLITLNDEI